jgi:patatin-like phospholipase/acyl hydrolase
MAITTKPIRILSIDGGGIRGIIPGIILAKLEKKLQKISGTKNKLAEYFDLIAGTSTGGILTCIYLCPSETDPTKPKYTAQDAVDLYLRNGGDIFHRSIWQLIGRAGGLWNEKYSSKAIESALSLRLEGIELKHFIKPCLITAYEINKRYAHFFTQHDAKDNEAYNYKAEYVARATSAAPTYFEAARIKSKAKEVYSLVDGGIFANNPTLCAYAEARNLKFDENRKNPTATNMIILSLGTGTFEKPYTYRKTKRWGIIKWIKPLIDIMMSGVSETVHHQMKQIYDSVDKPEQYLRINPKLNKSIEMDNASGKNLDMLEEIGLRTAEEHDSELERFAKMLMV